MKSISHTPSIYQIRHIESGKVYVGSAINPHERCRTHQKELRHQYHHSRHLQSAWNKYGEDAFVFEILEPVLFVEDLVGREQYWIDALHAADRKHGYNASPTAGSPLGVKYSDEIRARQSERGRQRFLDPVEREKLVERGRKALGTPLKRAQAAERMRKYFSDPAARAKVGEEARARWDDPEYRQQQVEQGNTTWADPEMRAEQAERARTQWSDPAFREMMLDTLKRARRASAEKLRAVHADPEFRAKQAERARKYWADPAHREKRKQNKKRSNDE